MTDDILGMWKIDEVNAIDMSFKQTWKSVEELESDPDVPPMQKMMARTAFFFEPDGRLLQLMPSDLAEGEGERFDDAYVIGKSVKWKEEGGKLFASSEENGEDVWSEVVPLDGRIELYGFFRLSKPGKSASGCGGADFKGVWVIKEAMMFDKDLNRSWRAKEDVMADESLDEDLKSTFDTRFVFDENGTMYTVLPIPEYVTQEQIDQALASGELELYGDGFMALEKHPWKMEDGKLMVDTGAKAEVFGEEISPWVEATIADGVMQYMTYRLVKERS